MLYSQRMDNHIRRPRQALGCSLFDNKNWVWGRRMAEGRPPSFISFTCAHCQALYHETTEAEVTCRACGAPLPGREGKFVLKYFMLRNEARGRRRGSAKTGERPEETI